MSSRTPLPHHRLLGLAALLLFTTGCGSITFGGGSSEVTIDTRDVARAAQAGSILSNYQKARQKLSPEARYHLGRAVAARLVTRDGLVTDPTLTIYVQRVGRSLAFTSPRPEVYGGYRFAVLASDDANAYACPGGLVLITRGLLERVSSEDELAAVLAHEFAHVQLEHGEQLIEEARWNKFLKSVAAGAVMVQGAPITSMVGALDAVSDGLVDRLVKKGYGKDFELAADAYALTLVVRAGYDPHALDRVLAELEDGRDGRRAFRRTHPELRERRKQLRPTLAKIASRPVPDLRQERFARALAGLGTATR